MNILIVCHGWPLEKFGGVGLYVQALIKALSSLGHDITLLTPERDLEIVDSVLHTRQHDWGLHWKLSVPAARNWTDSWKHPSTHAALKTVIGNRQPDVVHLHHLDGLPLDFWQLLPKQTAKVITLHDYAIPCARGQFVNNFSELCVGPSAKKCQICLGHRLRPHPLLNKISQRISSQFLKKIGQKLINPGLKWPRHRDYIEERLESAKTLVKDADLCFSPSRHLQARIDKIGWPRPQHHALPLLAPIHPSPAPPAEPKKIIFASRISPNKGLHVLLEALSQLPKKTVTLTIIGEMESSDSRPNYPEEMKRMIQAGKDNGHAINYLDHLPHHEVLALLHEHHIFILPSLWPENAPISVREAAAAGLQIICRRDSGSAEGAKQAVTIDPTPSNLAKAILETPITRVERPADILPLEHARQLVEYYVTVGDKIVEA